MGCGFVVAVPEDEVAAASTLLAAHHPGTRPIGAITAHAGTVRRPG
jgi:phosphoribosylaminoimidazole (AIR) synthetase